MLRPAILTLIAVAAIALALSGRGSSVPAPAAVLALAPSLSVEDCLEVDTGDTFTVAISAAGVTNLLAWDIYYAYDRKILEVVARDVRQFLDKEPNSNVFDLSDPVPNTKGVYRVGAADTGGPGTDEDGSGVLAVITLRARSEGLSWSSLLRFDTDGDGDYDYGPTLTETGGGHIGDSNGDGVFDGPVGAGQIAVGRTCREPAPTPFVEPDVIIVPVVHTPAAGTVTPTPTNRPDGSTPEPAGTDAASPTGGDGSTLSPSRSPTPTARSGSNPGGGDGGSGGGLSPLLATLIGSGGGAGIIASYLIFRAVRRPA